MTYGGRYSSAELGNQSDRVVGVLDASWWSTGHHPGFFHGVCSALEASGYQVVAIAPPGLGAAHLRVLESSPRIPVRQFLKASRWHQRAVARLDAAGAKELIDLYLDLSAPRYALMRNVPSRGTFVLHGLPNDSPRGLPGRIRKALALRGMRRIVNNDGQIVVHTDTAVRWLQRRSIQANRLKLPPNRTADVAAEIEAVSTNRPFVLAVGDTRPEKGFELIKRAASLVHDNIDVVAVGRPPADDSTAGIQHLGFVSDDRLTELQRRAAATVVPYTSEFRRKGAASSVAVESLAAGCPVVAPAWMLEQLRPAHLSVETYDEDTPASLAEAIRRAVDASGSRQALLRSGLAAQISRLHSFDNYVVGLTTASSLD